MLLRSVLRRVRVVSTGYAHPTILSLIARMPGAEHCRKFVNFNAPKMTIGSAHNSGSDTPMDGTTTDGRSEFHSHDHVHERRIDGELDDSMRDYDDELSENGRAEYERGECSDNDTPMSRHEGGTGLPKSHCALTCPCHHAW